MIEQTESNTGKKVDEATADSGYGGYASYEYLEERRIDGYVPDMYFHQYKSGEYKKEENRYNYSILSTMLQTIVIFVLGGDD